MEAGGPSCLLGAGGGPAPPSGPLLSGPDDPLGASEVGVGAPLLGGFAGVDIFQIGFIFSLPECWEVQFLVLALVSRGKSLESGGGK